MRVWKEEALCRSCLAFKNKVLVAILQDCIRKLIITVAQDTVLKMLYKGILIKVCLCCYIFYLAQLIKLKLLLNG